MQYPFFSASRIQQSLSSRGGAILKSKGQNFLVDPNSVRRIGNCVMSLLPETLKSADTGTGESRAAGNSSEEIFTESEGPRIGPSERSGEIPAECEILEIGPGTGALSFFLWESLFALANSNPETRFRYRALELDPVLCSILEEETLPAWRERHSIMDSSHPHSNLEFQIIEGDARSFLTETGGDAVTGKKGGTESGSKSAQVINIICGNLPYYISTELLLLSIKQAPHACCFLVQKEYAMRILETKKSSSIAVFVRNFMEPLKGPAIARNSFLPPPAVESTVLMLKGHEVRCDPGLLEPLLRMSFQGKRKTLRNSWRNSGGSLPVEALEEAATACGVDSMARAEDLSPESFYGMVGYLAGRLPA
ncbi:MAG: hypothetical protein CMN76_20625 [Spirochaetaceae bacterium]|nr:hypothetical protein [Spirochaetaceae bacterium]|tara:strand:- start:6731 stop:7825 length:1095 start_codon:yes stop_codon:yes gene_type:complete